ncbi:DNase I-like protein [Gymnopus androsaceus JB14]|uniref:DNase I-like protein n=1 Tax=Gymnopus androsaceus JB14 TaxID=1447944 RepID=A0A6A4HUG4_9AGAR|nr:DNase I-like protein [Gymnopus androsaceus JB14]
MSNIEKSRKPQLTVRTGEAQQSVISRLQGLFPTSPNPLSGGLPSSANDSDSIQRMAQSARLSPKFLKIRILTWNMHDSVPKGDLTELFEEVPYYTPPHPSSSSPQFPQFNANAGHPYHVILVAGQECPSTSGIPMGLGAGFKLMEDNEKPRSSKLSHGHESIKSKKSNDEYTQEPLGHNAGGWTSMVEDWLCHGGSIRTTSPATSEISAPKPLSPRTATREKKGPYTLVCKDRLLGIYLAMYVHRDLLPLVESTSKAFVPAGLLGGRWGNKGGVAISAKIDGKSFLFMNCHLAAQVDKANLHDRLNNFNKIKAELAVDDFLANDDPRVMAEDLTDKFDYTFVFGDLNFRLDISSSKISWIMAERSLAFKEADILFPPTFKYDVLRTLKRHKTRPGSRLDRLRYPYEKSNRLTEVDEKELEREYDAEHDNDDGEKDSDGEDGEDREADGDGYGEGDGEGEAESASIASSGWTSTHSRAVTDQYQEEDYFGSSPNMIRSANEMAFLLLSPTAPSSPTKWLKRPSFLDQQQQSLVGKLKTTQSAEDLKLGSHDSEASPDAGSLHTTQRSRVNSSKSHVQSDEDDNSEDKGVYDSSHKKLEFSSRCDRILFKSTVNPDPEDEPAEPEQNVRTRNKMGLFLANAFRPLSSRSRNSSISSFVHSVASSVSTHTSGIPTPKGDTTPSSPLHSPDLLEQVAPFSRFVYGDTHVDTPSAEATNQISLNEFDTSERDPRRASTSAPPIPPESSPYARDPVQREPVPTPSKWRFFPFLHNTSTNSSDVITTASTISGLKPPRKGDIVCLSYDTLDDRGMRRLEGRSDHRPVIGSYAVYM